MNQDWIERDRMLTEVVQNTKFIKETISLQKAAVDSHIEKDEQDFRTLKKRIFYLTIAVVVIGVVIGGPQFAMTFIR